MQALWGAALVLRRAAAASAAEADADSSAPEAAPGCEDGSAGAGADTSTLLCEPIVLDILAELEAPAWGGAGGLGASPDPARDLAAAPDSAWHLLQCACALRRMLAPPPPPPPPVCPQVVFPESFPSALLSDLNSQH